VIFRSCIVQRRQVHDIELLLQEVVEIDISRIAARLGLNKKFALSSSPLIQVQKALEGNGANAEMLGRVDGLAPINQDFKLLPLYTRTQTARTSVVTIIRSTYDLTLSRDLPSFLGRSSKTTDITRTLDSMPKVGHYYSAVRQPVFSGTTKELLPLSED
jgi:hypothetical protein